MSALLCDKVHVQQLDLPNLDVNLNEIPNSMDEFWIHREECCYGTHTGLRCGNRPRMSEYNKCGWDATFKDIPLHVRNDLSDINSKNIEHYTRACPDEYNRKGKVIWMDFIKVART